MKNVRGKNIPVILPLIIAILGLLSLNLFLRESKQTSKSEYSVVHEAVASSPSFEKEILREMNLARTKPLVYAKYIEELLDKYDGKLLRRSGNKVLITREGIVAAEEAIRYLKTVKPAGALSYSPGLSLAARDHVADQGPS